MVTVISETKQEFNGEVFYKCGYYFQKKGRRLHREVYKHYYGEIPKGCAVHHIDGDRNNNQPENLMLVIFNKHTAMHSLEPWRRELSRKAISVAMEKAKEWHRSKEGRAWHREHYQKTKHKLHSKGEFTCEWCGGKYTAEINNKNRFCSNTCKAAERRWLKKDFEERTCYNCGASFQVNKYAKTKHCSKKCAQATRR